MTRNPTGATGLQLLQMRNNPFTDPENHPGLEMTRLDASTTQAAEEASVVPLGPIDEDAHSTHGLLSLSRSD